MEALGNTKIRICKNTVETANFPMAKREHWVPWVLQCHVRNGESFKSYILVRYEDTANVNMYCAKTLTYVLKTYPVWVSLLTVVQSLLCQREVYSKLVGTKLFYLWKTTPGFSSFFTDCGIVLRLLHIFTPNNFREQNSVRACGFH